MVNFLPTKIAARFAEPIKAMIEGPRSDRPLSSDSPPAVASPRVA
jgi:hypothetical protein